MVAPSPSTNIKSLSAATVVGDIVQFGNMSWHILDIDGDYALLFADWIVHYVRPFTVTLNALVEPSLTWEDNRIRTWLNADSIYDFMVMFTDDEKARIRQTHIVTQDNNRAGNLSDYFPGGNDTNDYVFIFDRFEVEKYLFDATGQPLPLAFGRHQNSISYWGTRDHMFMQNGELVRIDLYFHNQLHGVRPAMWVKIN
jgi:hypothetical protein